MQKIVYVPLDERPCNYSFPNLLSDQTEVNLLRPSLNLMGDKKSQVTQKNYGIGYIRSQWMQMV